MRFRTVRGPAPRTARLPTRPRFVPVHRAENDGAGVEISRLDSLVWDNPGRGNFGKR
jgi:hypothetical protein